MLFDRETVFGRPFRPADSAGGEIPGNAGGLVPREAGLYFVEYCVIHGKDMYWTGEKIAAAPEKFRTFLAINQGCVVGYLDVTHCFEENEPYDIYVLPEYRRKGYGRKLLAKALDCNQPRGMMLLVETDNTAAIRLYELMNFKTVPGQNRLTVHWQIPEEKEIDFEKEMRYS